MAMQPYRPAGDLFHPLEALFGSLSDTGMSGLMRAPNADVVERENEIEVDIEIPGMRPEDIEIDLENNVLTVSGEKKEEREEGQEGGRFHLSERRYGRFTRSFVLPRDVEAEQIRAECDGGLLKITVPKSERARRRRIEVSSGEAQGRRIEAPSGEDRK
jgi:HSP20 family protein